MQCHTVSISEMLLTDQCHSAFALIALDCFCQLKFMTINTSEIRLCRTADVILQRRGKRIIPAVLNSHSTAALLGNVELAFMKTLATDGYGIQIVSKRLNIYRL